MKKTITLFAAVLLFCFQSCDKRNFTLIAPVLSESPCFEDSSLILETDRLERAVWAEIYYTGIMSAKQKHAPAKPAIHAVRASDAVSQ